MTFEILFVLLALLGMVIALVLDKMRPGMVLFSVVVLFLCAGILTPKEMLEGFSNKGMMTVAMLFLVSEGIRQSGALGQVIKKLLPQGKTTVFKAQFRMFAHHCFYFSFSKQYSGGCYLCSHYQALGRICKIACYQVPYTPFLCDDTWRNLHPDRDVDQSGGAWYDIGSRI